MSSWEIRSIDNIVCAIGTLLEGSPIDYGTEWSHQFAAQLASALRHLHEVPASGWGPLADTSKQLAGTSPSEKQGIIDRWSQAAIWPFDDSDFSSHPISSVEPDLAPTIAGIRADILDAADQPFGVLHSDLHNQHILMKNDALTGLLDFGDAFIGSLAWDFALIYWYYGRENLERFANAYGADVKLLEQGIKLATAVGCYKVAKTPHDTAARKRLRAVVPPTPSSS